MAAVLGHAHQLAVGVHAIRIAIVLKVFADAFRAIAFEQAHGLRVIAEKVAVIAVSDVREQLDHLRPRNLIPRLRGIVERLDRGHRHFNVAFQGGLCVIEQALPSFLHFLVGLILQNPDSRQTHDQGKQQDRQHCEGQHFCLQAQAHGFYSF